MGTRSRPLVRSCLSAETASLGGGGGTSPVASLWSGSRQWIISAWPDYFWQAVRVLETTRQATVLTARDTPVASCGPVLIPSFKPSASTSGGQRFRHYANAERFFLN